MTAKPGQYPNPHWSDRFGSVDSDLDQDPGQTLTSIKVKVNCWTPIRIETNADPLTHHYPTWGSLKSFEVRLSLQWWCGATTYWCRSSDPDQAPSILMKIRMLPVYTYLIILVVESLRRYLIRFRLRFLLLAGSEVSVSYWAVPTLSILCLL